MVHGLDKFKEYFECHTDQYVFIGGTACTLLLDELGAVFRATKDLDMVLIIEALDITFGDAFWKFIEDGGYKQRQKATGAKEYYRFSHPKDESFPIMIELFSRRPSNLQHKSDSRLAPIHIDESIVSLSAILLNDVYYNCLINGKRTISGFSVIEIETVILFKIKAYLDMKKRKETGEDVDSKSIKKHKNDVFRLLVNITPSVRVEVEQEIHSDIQQFIEMTRREKPDLMSLGISNANFEELVAILKSVFMGSSGGQ